jgi:protein-disulfide isomerase
MKRYLPFVIVAVVAVATLVSGAILYRAKRPHLLTIPQDKIIPGKGDTASMHIRGEPDAPVTLEEFGDFECPPCRNISTFLDELLKEHHPHLRVVFRNFPLKQHKHAYEAALAAEAAGAQGHFWEMHDVLYREQVVWSKANHPRALFQAYAGTIGLNVDQFNKDSESHETMERVDVDEARGASIGVKSTPSLFLNNKEVGPDDRTPEGVRKLVDAAVKGKSPSSPVSPAPTTTGSPTLATTPSPTPTATPQPEKK